MRLDRLTGAWRGGGVIAWASWRVCVDAFSGSGELCYSARYIRSGCPAVIEGEWRATEIEAWHDAHAACGLRPRIVVRPQAYVTTRHPHAWIVTDQRGNLWHVPARIGGWAARRPFQGGALLPARWDRPPHFGKGVPVLCTGWPF